MSMTYVDCLISKGGRVEGWIFKKGPSGDVDDLRHSSISRFLRVEGWKGGFLKMGQAEMLMAYVGRPAGHWPRP